MNILGYKSGGHDGTLSYIEDGKLVYSIEAEKDSGDRYSLFSSERVEDILLYCWQSSPEIVCGDSLKFSSRLADNYIGTTKNDVKWSALPIGMKNKQFASVPHELSHIVSAFALSDLPERTAFYALVWEGYIGRFYYVDEDFNITKLGNRPHVLDCVGVRYSIPYHATGKSNIHGLSAAGKIMALAGLYKGDGRQTEQEAELLKLVLNQEFTSKEDN